MSKQWSAVISLGAFLLVALALPAMAQFSTRNPQTAPDTSSQTANPPMAANVAPEGTKFIVKLDDSLDIKKVKPGKHFKAKLAEDLLSPSGTVLIPRGKGVKGHVSTVDRGFKGRLLLSFDEIETRHGWVPLVATVSDVPGEHGIQISGSEGEISGRKTDTKRVIESGAIGAGVGAAAGAAAGGAHGAIIGVAAGAGVGVGAGLLTGRDLKLDKGQKLELRLDRQVVAPEH